MFVIGLLGEPVGRKEERTRDSYGVKRQWDGEEKNASSGLTVVGRRREARDRETARDRRRAGIKQIIFGERGIR